MWLGSKRKDICGIIEFKWPRIREHSFYSQSKDKFIRFPLNLNKPLVINNIHLDSDNLFYFWIFLSSFIFFCTHFLFFFFCIYTHVVLIKIKNSPIHLTINLTSLFSPTWIQTKPYLKCSPILWQGTNNMKV